MFPLETLTNSFDSTMNLKDICSPSGGGPPELILWGEGSGPRWLLGNELFKVSKPKRRRTSELLVDGVMIAPSICWKESGRLIITSLQYYYKQNEPRPLPAPKSCCSASRRLKATDTKHNRETKLQRRRGDAFSNSFSRV